MSIKFEVLKPFLLANWPSLNAFPDKYLSLFFTHPENTPNHFAYVCPICTKNGLITLEDGSSYDTKTEFTLDHFPPEAVGGKLTALVCKKCNNEAGAHFENALKQKIEAISFNNKKSAAKIKTKAQISDVKGNYPSLLSIREDGTFEISFKPTEKIHAPLLDDWLERSKTDNNWTAEVTIPVPDEAKVSKALLKAAYLYCFSYWGYDFSYSDTASQMRQILRGELVYPLNNPSFWLGGVAKTVPRLQLGLCYIKSPAELKCFAVNMLLTDKETGFNEIASVLIPGPGANDWKNLERIQVLLDGEPTMDVTFEHVMNYGISDNIYDGYAQSWAYLKNL